MTFDEFWSKLLSRQPWMSDLDKRFEGRVSELHRLCGLAYDAGYRHGEDSAVVRSGIRGSSGGTGGSHDVPDFLKDLLGGFNLRK